ncbi:hypothetical protein ABZ348_10055 [Streptomyces sp. NPDC005963]|uniref:hypothetical protein n=1 Tax=Streptomyces sp. NPDC005963 TaxID=3156721 RepID=UPI0033C752B6
MTGYRDENGQQQEAESPEEGGEQGRENGSESPGHPGDNGRRLPESIPGPFLSERPFPGRGFRHDGGAQAASVVFYEGGGCTVFTVNGPHEVRERRFWARPLSVCYVACGRHITSFDVRLPAAGAATFFVTKITLRWKVTDYERVAVNQLSSVERDLGEEIVDRLREVSERYPVREAQQANTAIRADIRAGRWRDLGAEVGLSAELFVDVGTDEVIIGQVHEARTDEGEEQRVGRRFAAYSKLAAGSASDRLAYLMASGTKQDVKGVITMMQEDDAQGRSDTRDFFLRMLEQDRITSPELEAHLRSLILPGQRSPDPQYEALAERALPPSPPPRLSLPPGSSGGGGAQPPRGGSREEPPWPGADTGPRSGQPREGRVWNDGSWVDEDRAAGAGGRGGSSRRPERDLWDDDDAPRAQLYADEPRAGRSSAGGRSGEDDSSRRRPHGGRSDDERASDRPGPDRGSRRRSADARDSDSGSADRWSSSGSSRSARSERGRSDDQGWQDPPRGDRDRAGGRDRDRDRESGRDRDRDRDDSGWDRGDRPGGGRDTRDGSRRQGEPRPADARREGSDGSEGGRGGRSDGGGPDRGRTRHGSSWDDEERDRSGAAGSAGGRGREDRTRDGVGRDAGRRDDRSWDAPEGRSGTRRSTVDGHGDGRTGLDRRGDGPSRDDRRWNDGDATRDGHTEDRRTEDRHAGDSRAGDERYGDDQRRDDRYGGDRYRSDRPRDDRYRDDRYRDEPPRRGEDRRERRGDDYWSVSDDEGGRG